MDKFSDTFQRQLELSRMKAQFWHEMSKNRTLNYMIQRRMAELAIGTGFAGLRGLDGSYCLMEPCYTKTERGTYMAGLLITAPPEVTHSQKLSTVLHLAEVDTTQYEASARPAPGAIDMVTGFDPAPDTREYGASPLAQLDWVYEQWQSCLGEITKNFNGSISFAERTGTLEIQPNHNGPKLPEPYVDDGGEIWEEGW